MARKINKRSKRRLVVLGTISVIAIGSFFYTFGSYVYNYVNLVDEGEILSNRIDELNGEKVELKNDITKLQDPEYIVRYAKENFYYTEDGEYVLKLEDEETLSVVDDASSMSFSSVLLIVFGIFSVLFILKKIAKKA